MIIPQSAAIAIALAGSLVPAFALPSPAVQPQTRSVSPFPVQLCYGADIEDASVATLTALFDSGNLTSEKLTRCYLDRIALTNQYLHAVIETNPDAISIAKKLDVERAAGKCRGPLHGIPFVSKDNFYTDDKHNTSEGGLVLLGGRYSREATVIVKAREAGMVLLGHAALSEAADHRALSNFSDGYSARGGQTRNPYNFTQATSGSSGGSAVSVAANLAAVAFGTETHGSMVHPAAQLGVVGIKSTPGLISRTGVVPGSFYHDTPGPFAHDVHSAALVLDVIYGPDRYDNLTWNQLGRTPTEGYAAHVNYNVSGLRLGVPWNPFWNTMQHSVINSPGNRALFEGRLHELKAAGAKIYNVTIPNIEDLANPYGFGQKSSFYGTEHDGLIAFYNLLDVGYAEWLSNWTFPEGDARSNFTTLADMAAWNREHNSTTGALGNSTYWHNTVSGQDFYDSAIASGGILNDTFWTAMDFTRRTARAAIDQGHTIIEKNGTVIQLDALLIPSQNAGGGDNPCASMPAYAGHPAMSVPLGQNDWDVPAAMCLWGREYGEAKLIRAAAAMEAVWQWKATPMWHNYETASGPWETPYPGYACTDESLDNMGCEAP
ncbi:hypothetical protein IAT38_006259 [Cryptococcus sp. DSM 104549]